MTVAEMVCFRRKRAAARVRVGTGPWGECVLVSSGATSAPRDGHSFFMGQARVGIGVKHREVL